VRVYLVRLLFSVLIVRAIFISPAQGTEFGSHQAGSSLKKHDRSCPARLRFTKPCPPSATQERVDCCGGGDDEERTHPAEVSDEVYPRLVSLRWTASNPPALQAGPRLLVRLRC